MERKRWESAKSKQRKKCAQGDPLFYQAVSVYDQGSTAELE
jgi:hypothetical protein